MQGGFIAELLEIMKGQKNNLKVKLQAVDSCLRKYTGNVKL